MEKEIIIGIPIKNDLESFKQMIISLRESTKKYDKIILAIGKGTNKEAEQYIQFLCEHSDNIYQTQERFDTPLDAYNYLFNYAKKEKSDLFVTQTDVLFPKLYKRDWLKLMNIIALNEQIGAITCLNGTGVSGHDYINGFEWLGGWCTYYPFRTLEKIGGYDKDFPNGYGVDIDHSWRIFKSGLKIVKINYWVDHHMMNERLHDNDLNTEQMKKESSEYFKKKWKL